jgi:hypothetical protein
MEEMFSNMLILLNAQQVETRLPVPTVFDGVYLPQHKLQLHFVNITHSRLGTIDPGYFSTLSDQAAQQNIRLIHVWSDVYHNHPSLVGSRLLALIGKRERIHARQTTIERIDKKQADDFLNLHHLQQSAAAYYKYGLIHKDTLIAVATFSKSRIMHDGPVLYRSYELIRFASKQGTTVTGGLGKLIKHFVNEHHAVHLMTYADRDWSAGAGYEKLGFKCVEIISPHHFYIHPREMVRYYPLRLPQGINEEEAIRNGYIRIYNSGSLKYVLDKRA